MVIDEQPILNYNTVRLSEILDHDIRFEATVFDIEGKKARDILAKCGVPITTICGDSGVAKAFHRPRFKRVWLEKSDYPIYQPSKILNICPTPSGYISALTDTDIDCLRVKKGQVLLTCSGTIGNTTIVTERLDNSIFSHDLIRITCNDPSDTGYLYVYLNTKTGRTILETNNYGAVISHIEPEHLDKVPIPYAEKHIRMEISSLIEESFLLRDESNKLVSEARNLLKTKLKLCSMNEINKETYKEVEKLENFTVKLSDTSLRFDTSFCKPIYKTMNDNLKKEALRLVPLGDNSLTKSIILAGVFKRVYVEEGLGYPFLGGKEITQLNPKIEKFLSRAYHNQRYEKELKIFENTILVTDRGTIGKVAIAPKHFEDFAVSQNVIKVHCVSDYMAGYIYAVLSSEYGVALIKKETYGSVVDMIDNNNLGNINIPILQNEEDMKVISDKVLEANKKRYKAYLKEKEALDIMNKKVLKIV